jgi:hypothetical protein
MHHQAWVLTSMARCAAECLSSSATTKRRISLSYALTTGAKAHLDPSAGRKSICGDVKKKPHREKAVYLKSLRDHTSIGRGDRPPYFINVADMMHDSELVDLVVDCKAREISFNWRRTLSAFFMERHFIVLANQNGLRHEYDKDIDSAEFDVSRIEWTRKSFRDRHCDYWRQARRKRMQPWTKKNKKRISKVLRSMTEDTAVRLAQSKVLQYVRELIVDTPEDYNDPQEIVPEKCAKDYRELMLWPTNKKETRRAWYELQNKQPHVCCTM